jgi:hypothetical protein
MSTTGLQDPSVTMHLHTPSLVVHHTAQLPSVGCYQQHSMLNQHICGLLAVPQGTACTKYTHTAGP